MLYFRIFSVLAECLSSVRIAVIVWYSQGVCDFFFAFDIKTAAIYLLSVATAGHGDERCAARQGIAHQVATCVFVIDKDFNVRLVTNKVDFLCGAARNHGAYGE